MQPYQTATEEIKRQGDIPKNLVQQGASAAAAIGGASVFGKGLAEKALALASNYLPENLAIKGLTKLDARFGKMITLAVNAGQTGREAIDFIAGKAKEGMEQEQAQDKRNLIEKHSPELHQFITEQMKKGKSHKEAGALATIGVGGKDFKKEIEKLKKDHKTSWEEILESVYGGGKQAAGTAPAAQMPNQPSGGQNPAMQQAQQQQQSPTDWGGFKEEMTNFFKS